jgi:ABC-type amino acid transport substrate-binding protein
MIDNGDVATIKVKGIEHGLQLLKLKRLDALIDFGVLLKYQLREKGLTDQLVLADLPADEFDLHCAYSKKMNISAGDLNLIFTELKKKGELDKILNQYQ